MTGLRSLLVAIAPKGRREWIAAMIAEREFLSGPARVSWWTATLLMAVELRLRDCPHSVQAGALAVLMIIEDWIWGGMVPALALMGLSAAVLTRPGRHRCASACLVAGGTLPFAHVIANWIPPLRPAYQVAMLDARDWLLLATVGAIGLCAVQIAGALRARRRP